MGIIIEDQSTDLIKCSRLLINQMTNYGFVSASSLFQISYTHVVKTNHKIRITFKA